MQLYNVLMSSYHKILSTGTDRSEKTVQIQLRLLLKKHSDLYLHCSLFNPTALRKAKIAYNFGLSECNRVKEQYVKVYTVCHAICILWMHYCIVKQGCPISKTDILP